MLKKTVLVMLLGVASMKAKSQYLHYESIPYGSSPATSTNPYEQNSSSQQSLPPAREVQRVAGYVIDGSTGTVVKINLQIAQFDRSTAVVAYKELSSNYWTPFSSNKPVAQKLMFNEAHSDHFEFKVYIPSLGKVVYF